MRPAELIKATSAGARWGRLRLVPETSLSALIFSGPSRPEQSRLMTVRELLDLRDHLAVPHFQRGQVWGTRDQAALLESLSDGTPIGTFLLWESGNPTEDGEALLEAKGPLRHLVIDGQQRLSTMISELLPATKGVQPARADEPQWCLNLNAVPECQQFVKDPGGRRRGRFAQVRDPRWLKTNRETHHRQGGESFWNYVPLWVFFLKNEDDFLTQARERCKEAVEKSIGELLIRLRKPLWRMREQSVWVVTYGQQTTFDEMLRLYVRINSTGSAAQAEERAFAEVQRVDREAHQRIRDIFRDIHPDRPGTRDHLKRMREAQMGFKFFLRTFVQVCAWHLRMSKEALSPSLDFIDRESDMRKLEALKSLSPQLWDRTAEIVRFLSKKILDKHLGIDDPRFLPATSPLLPLIQCLVMFPSLRDEKCAPLLASFSLTLLLERPSQQTRDKMMEKIIRQRTAADALGCLDEYCKNSIAHIRGIISQASGERHHATLLLYGLLRMRGARDFSYGLNTRDLARMPKEGREQVLLAKEWAPEAQHIIPLNSLKHTVLEPGMGPSEAANQFDEEVEARGPRGRKGPANSIGNLTYISKALNSWEHGLGPRLFDSVNEDPDNLSAHLLSDFGKPELKTRLDALTQCKANERVDGVAYTSFVDLRTGIIGDAFVDWIRGLSSSHPSVDPNDGLERRLIDALAIQEYLRELHCAHIEPRRVAALEKLLESLGSRVVWAYRKTSPTNLLRVHFEGTTGKGGVEPVDLKLCEDGSLTMPPRRARRADVSQMPSEESDLLKSLKALVANMKGCGADFGAWATRLGYFEPILSGEKPELPEPPEIGDSTGGLDRTKRKPPIESAGKFLELVGSYSSSDVAAAKRVLDCFRDLAAQGTGIFVVGYKTTTANLYWQSARNQKRRVFALTSKADFGVRPHYLEKAGRSDVLRVLRSLFASMLPDQGGHGDWRDIHLTTDNAELVLKFLNEAVRQIQPMLALGEHAVAVGPSP